MRYDWRPEDVDTPGRFLGWFVREKEGRTEHFPTEGRNLVIEVVETG